VVDGLSLFGSVCLKSMQQFYACFQETIRKLPSEVLKVAQSHALFVLVDPRFILPSCGEAARGNLCPAAGQAKAYPTSEDA